MVYLYNIQPTALSENSCSKEKPINKLKSQKKPSSIKNLKQLTSINKDFLTSLGFTLKGNH